jgi:PEP-CTERM motif
LRRNYAASNDGAQCGATPIPAPADLQSWTRGDISENNLEPDWLRVGTDIVGAVGDPATITQFNASFSLSGSPVPEPSTRAMMLLGFAGLGFAGYRHARKARFARGMSVTKARRKPLS